MEFEIEKNIKTSPDNIFDELRPSQRKELFADFNPAFLWIELIKQAQCGFLGIEIHGDNDWFIQNNFPGLSD